MFTSETHNKLNSAFVQLWNKTRFKRGNSIEYRYT